MAASDWRRQLTLWSTEVAPLAFPGVLDEINEALKNTGPFSYLMLDYWNGPGTFSHYTVGRQELTRCIADCTGGSAFGEVAEVRWRKVGSVLRTVLVAEADLSRLPLHGVGSAWRLEDNDIERALRGNSRPESILLWGSRRLPNGTWVEARIPRPLVYPTIQEQHDSYDQVRLYFVEYRDERGRVIVHRRTHLTARVKPSQSNEGNGQEGEDNHGETTA